VVLTHRAHSLHGRLAGAQMSWFLDWITRLFAARIDSATVHRVQAATVKACGFLPMAESVIALANAGPAAIVPMLIAKQICAVVTSTSLPLQLTSAPQTWIVNGVEIHGDFVK